MTWDNVTEIKFNIFGSKKRKVSRCRPVVSNEAILATRQEFFLTDIAPVQNTADIVLLDFWLMLLSWIFISSYTTIYFFVKKFYFFKCLCFSEYDIRMSLYVFWLRKGPSIKYVWKVIGCLLKFSLIKRLLNSPRFGLATCNVELITREFEFVDLNS